MADVVSIVLLIVGALLIFLALVKSFGNKSTLAGVVGLFVLIFGIVGFAGMIDYGSLGKVSQTSGFTSGQFTPPPQVASSSCSPNAITSNGKSQADILIRNVENASLGYLSGTVSANAGGAFIDSVASNAGASASYASMSNIPNCASGELVVTLTTGTGLASSKRVRDVEKNQLVSGYNFNDRSVHKYEILSASNDVINILSRSSTLAAASNGQVNGSQEVTYAVSGTGAADGTAYHVNTSLGSKGSINFYIDINVNGSSTVAGQYDEADGILISFDTGTAARYSVNSLSLAVDQPAGFSLTKHANCPTDIVNNRNVEACWSAPTMKAGTLYRIRGTLTADLGDPLPTDIQPIIHIDDKVSFRDTDGNIKYGFFSTSGTNQGVGGTALRFVAS